MRTLKILTKLKILTLVYVLTIIGAVVVVQKAILENENPKDYELENLYIESTYEEDFVNQTTRVESFQFGILDYLKEENGFVHTKRTDPTPINFDVKNDHTEPGEVYDSAPTKRDYMERRMTDRRQHLKRQCSKASNKMDKIPPNPWEYVLDYNYHLVWCPIFKAASSSWIFNFNLLAGYDKFYLMKQKPNQRVELLRKKYSRPTDINEVLSAMYRATTLLIVRHPFERLISAYRDKIREHPVQLKYEKLFRKIIRLYRNRKDSLKWPPTFVEFIRYIIDTRGNVTTFDEHWIPMTMFCSPCSVLEYDVIVKFETLQEDQQYFIEKAHLRHIINPVWFNRANGTLTAKVTEKYFKQLTEKQVLTLGEIYKWDLVVFDYKLEPYLKFAKDLR